MKKLDFRAWKFIFLRFSTIRAVENVENFLLPKTHISPKNVGNYGVTGQVIHNSDVENVEKPDRCGKVDFFRPLPEALLWKSRSLNPTEAYFCPVFSTFYLRNLCDFLISLGFSALFGTLFRAARGARCTAVDHSCRLFFYSLSVITEDSV